MFVYYIVCMKWQTVLGLFCSTSSQIINSKGGINILAGI